MKRQRAPRRHKFSDEVLDLFETCEAMREAIMSDKFSIAWNRAFRCHRRGNEVWEIEAILCERVVLAGRPRLKIVCRVACIDEDRTGEVGPCEKFWHDARARLGRLYRLSDRDLDEIEALLARKVPRPQPEQAAE